jgi:flavin-binding protein dodecin
LPDFVGTEGHRSAADPLMPGRQKQLLHVDIPGTPVNFFAKGTQRIVSPGFPKERSRAMAVVKVIEVLAQSDKGWEDAAQKAVSEAARSVEDIRSIYIKDFEATVENNKITKYRINAKISFGIRGS